MKNTQLLLLLLSTFFFQFCSDDDSEEYVPILVVSVDLTKVPYTNLSEYHFFDGDIKEQKPNLGVLPYKPASGLFTDYANKKRFVWMPQGTKATYNGDDNVLELPVGAVLIKTFYYDNVQPSNVTKIIETRLLIRKSDGWKAYDYIWNDTQTGAVLDVTNNGDFKTISFKEKGVTKNVEYKIPSQTECITCHKLNPTQSTGGELTMPIGIKPQNLNTNYSYDSGVSQNQLAKWRSVGYLGNDIPANILSTVDWEDTSKSLELRARSYIDMNCAHCHRLGGHCDYTAMRFNFSNTNLATFGLCMVPSRFVFNGPFVINGGNAAQSEMIIRMNTDDGALKMPIIGRNLVHEEGVQLMKDWINTLPPDCR